VGKIHFKKILLLFVLMIFSACAANQSHMNFKPYKFEDGQYEAKVQNFMIILDASDSMYFSHNGVKKFNAVKDAATYINQTLPNLKIKGALRSFGHSQKVSNEQTVLQYGLTEYTKAGLEKGIDQVTSEGGGSPLAEALIAATKDLESASGKIGVIIISDGQDMKEKPILPAQEMKKAFGDRICIHSLLIGDSPEGKILMKKISDIGECGSYSELDNLVAENRMPDFIQTVFLTKFSDEDGDGVPDNKDRCPGTPADIKVNDDGCPIDSDGDSVFDYKDRCPDTPKQTKVNSFGCSVDSDGDGVTDNIDKCPDTPKGATVDEFGCWVCKNLNFELNKWDIKPEYHACLDEGVDFLNNNQEINVEIQGHTDNIGSKEYNQNLSEKRAMAVRDYLISKGIEEERLIIKGYGSSNPLTSNDTEERRSKNRRVQFERIKK
jgi:OOP family OmpA-OmpF porin